MSGKRAAEELCLKYLGHIICNGTIIADPGKIKAISKWTTLSTVK